MAGIQHLLLLLQLELVWTGSCVIGLLFLLWR